MASERSGSQANRGRDDTELLPDAPSEVPELFSDESIAQLDALMVSFGNGDVRDDLVAMQKSVALFQSARQAMTEQEVAVSAQKEELALGHQELEKSRRASKGKERSSAVGPGEPTHETEGNLSRLLSQMENRLMNHISDKFAALETSRNTHVRSPTRDSTDRMGSGQRPPTFRQPQPRASGDAAGPNLPNRAAAEAPRPLRTRTEYSARGVIVDPFAPAPPRNQLRNKRSGIALHTMQPDINITPAMKNPALQLARNLHQQASASSSATSLQPPSAAGNLQSTNAGGGPGSATPRRKAGDAMSPTPRESGSGKKHKSVHRSSDDPQTIDAVVTQFFNNMRAVNAFGGRVTIKPISQVPQATQDEVKRILKEGAKMSGIDSFFGSHWRKPLCLYSRLMKRAGGVFDLIEEGDAEKYPWKQCDMCAGKAGSICISLGKASDPDSNVGYLLGIPGQSISFGQSKSWQTPGPVRSAAGSAETSG